MLTDVQIAPLDQAGLPGPSVALPVAACIQPGPNGDQSVLVTLGAGAVPVSAVGVLLGGAPEVDGDVLRVADVLRPYVALRGKTLDQRGIACEVALPRVRFSFPVGHFKGGMFHVARWEGAAVPDATGTIFTVSE